MPLALLPATAVAFAPRTTPNIVLDRRPEPWLTRTLARSKRNKRPPRSAQQHHRCLSTTLSAPSAIWMLASIMVPCRPDDDDALHQTDSSDQAAYDHRLLHIRAYVVHVDMVAQHEIAFKLAQDSIDALTDYHRDVYLADAAADLPDWSDKAVRLQKLRDDFVLAVNRYVYRTHVRALEGLKEDGAGELPDGRCVEVKAAILSLFVPLLVPPPPPPTPPASVMAQHPMYAYPSSLVSQVVGPRTWWSPYQQQYPRAAPTIDPWVVLGSSPTPTLSDGELVSPCWSPSDSTEPPFEPPSPPTWSDTSATFDPPLLLTMPSFNYVRSPSDFMPLQNRTMPFPIYCSALGFGSQDLVTQDEITL